MGEHDEPKRENGAQTKGVRRLDLSARYRKNRRPKHFRGIGTEHNRQGKDAGRERIDFDIIPIKRAQDDGSAEIEDEDDEELRNSTNDRRVCTCKYTHSLDRAELGCRAKKTDHQTKDETGQRHLECGERARKNLPTETVQIRHGRRPRVATTKTALHGLISGLRKRPRAKPLPRSVRDAGK